MHVRGTSEGEEAREEKEKGVRERHGFQLETDLNDEKQRVSPSTHERRDTYKSFANYSA